MSHLMTGKVICLLSCSILQDLNLSIIQSNYDCCKHCLVGHHTMQPSPFPSLSQSTAVPGQQQFTKIKVMPLFRAGQFLY